MCEERYRLISEYVAAAKALSRAALRLRGRRWEELTEARAESDAARTECNIAREALLRHEIDHEGCAGPLSRRAETRAARS
jgi:F0F1-type ATP synthase membrane subunit b/b'